MSGRFNAPKLMGNCANCYYYTQTRPKHGEGVCRRYPKPLDRDDMDYCGEFAWKSDAAMLKGGERMTDNVNDRECASCYFFRPCPCGACSYGVCTNTCSTYLHEYAHGGSHVCSAYMEKPEEVTGKLTYSTGEGLR